MTADTVDRTLPSEEASCNPRRRVRGDVASAIRVDLHEPTFRMWIPCSDTTRSTRSSRYRLSSTARPCEAGGFSPRKSSNHAL